jgi:hypothetical protein
VEDIGAAICWCFRLSRAARETEGSQKILGLGGQGQALMIGELFAAATAAV